jgi:hypothetical protein
VLLADSLGVRQATRKHSVNRVSFDFSDPSESDTHVRTRSREHSDHWDDVAASAPPGSLSGGVPMGAHRPTASGVVHPVVHHRFRSPSVSSLDDGDDGDSTAGSDSHIVIRRSGIKGTVVTHIRRERSTDSLPRLLHDVATQSRELVPDDASPVTGSPVAGADVAVAFMAHRDHHAHHGSHQHHGMHHHHHHSMSLPSIAEVEAETLSRPGSMMSLTDPHQSGGGSGGGGSGGGGSGGVGDGRGGSSREDFPSRESSSAPMLKVHDTDGLSAGDSTAAAGSTSLLAPIGVRARALVSQHAPSDGKHGASSGAASTGASVVATEKPVLSALRVPAVESVIAGHHARHDTVGSTTSVVSGVSLDSSGVVI